MGMHFLHLKTIKFKLNAYNRTKNHSNEQNTIEISWQKKFQLNAKPKPTNHKFNPKQIIIKKKLKKKKPAL